MPKGESKLSEAMLEDKFNKFLQLLKDVKVRLKSFTFKRKDKTNPV